MVLFNIFVLFLYFCAMRRQHHLIMTTNQRSWETIELYVISTRIETECIARWQKHKVREEAKKNKKLN